MLRPHAFTALVVAFLAAYLPVVVVEAVADPSRMVVAFLAATGAWTAMGFMSRRVLAPRHAATTRTPLTLSTLLR